MKIVTTAALFFGLTASAFAMTPSQFSDLHSGSDSDQRIAARALALETNNTDINFALANNGSDSEQRMAVNSVLNGGGAVAASDILLKVQSFSGDDADQRRLAK